MTTMARTERQQLCDLALAVGQDQPTLCGRWTVKDLVVHLVLREGSPAAIGTIVPGLASVTDRAMARLARTDFTVLVERLRGGPPWYSPFALPKVDTAANSVEFFVHHEDIRRAQPSWQPRVLSAAASDLLWKQSARTGKLMVRKAGVGVIGERSDTGDRMVLRSADTSVVIRGLPAEVLLFAFGRKPQAQVELLGSDVDVATLQDASLGI